MSNRLKSIVHAVRSTLTSKIASIFRSGNTSRSESASSANTIYADANVDTHFQTQTPDQDQDQDGAVRQPLMANQMDDQANNANLTSDDYDGDDEDG